MIPAEWTELLDRLDAGSCSVPVYRELERRYLEPHRAYHNLQHIQHCINEFSAVRGQCPNPDAVELALWFHDAVYDPRAKDNEERSADLASAFIRDAELGETFDANVRRLILATKHAAVPTELDEQIIVDVDLAILGQAPEVFDTYEKNIRAEYAWVPEAEFRAGRSSILKKFLERPVIFSTPRFRERYEAAARANLQRSMAKLNVTLDG
ncbi:MAG TPA: N-methyl-D-aspartate receptor NMDAR2C subunit [Planctomycetota bacterium]|nr:N-methyl-D-aspartate receptor NMDAR2C subunit [Planctomycetota bacterium]